MTSRVPRGRSGVTLTEILIAILILGLGMVSLATLFPIGLMRLREAQRNSRSVLELESAIADIQARNLLDRSVTFPYANPPFTYDPWLQDGLPGAGGVYRGPDPDGAGPLLEQPGPGLPVMYDPLWWSVTQTPLNAANLAAARFGRGPSTLNAGPSDGTAPSAAGLQRITNLGSGPAVDATFVSPDDIVFQGEAPNTSPILPDLTGGQVQVDYAYSFAFTGQQTSAYDFTVYDGSIVIFHNRPFALDPGGAAGERVVEGIFAYGLAPGGGPGYSTSDPRVVMLRWSAAEPDPEVALGSWIADVTYEQSNTASITKSTSAGQQFPMQRCYWYRVAKRGWTEPDPTLTGFRRMAVTLTAPVHAKTLLQASSSTPVYTNAALLCPTVVNVFPKVVYTRY